MISLACEAGDHAQCYRSTCDCHCGHPGRLSDEDRARLEARPAPATKPRTTTPASTFETYPRRHRRRRTPRAERKCIDCDGPIDRPGRSTRCSDCYAVWDRDRPRGGGAPELVLPIEEIAAKYAAGAGSVELGEEYGCSATSIRKHLRKHGVAIRPPIGKPTPQIQLPIEEITGLYAAGWGLKRLATKYDCSPGTVKSRLQAAGVEIRRQGDRSIVLPIDDIVAAYLGGESCEAIARTYDVNPSTVATKLRGAGVDVDPHGRRRVPIDWDTLTREYLDGASADALAERHGCGATTVRTYLARAGIMRPVGSKPNGSPGSRIDLPIAVIVKRYRFGWSLEDLAAEYDCSTGPIRDRLVEAGIEIRPASRRAKAMA